MPGTTVDRTSNGLGPTRRPTPSPWRTRIGSRSHARRNFPRPSNRAANNEAVLQERARIARELHDTVSQTLYAITLGAVRARSLLQLNEGTEVQRIIDAVLQLAGAGQSELRALLTDIRSDRLASGGLTAALESLATDARTRSGLDIRVSLAGEPHVPEATKEALVMISREALHNVAKHGAAERVDIVLQANPGGLVLLITDDGRGFDPASPRPGHFGLQTMRERATAVGGTLGLISAVGHGTHIRVSVPGHVDKDG